MARQFARGDTVPNPPADLVEWSLLRALNGAYTLETLEDVPARVVNRWMMILQAEAEVANIARKKAEAEARRRR